MTSCFGRWWKPRLVLQEALLELLLELGWYLVKVGVLRTWSPPRNCNCPSAVFGIVTNLVEITSFALSFTLWNSDASIFLHLLKVSYHKSSFPNFSPPRTRRIRGVIRVILCSRIGGISIGQEQKWSDNHSNEPNKILWLNGFVEVFKTLMCFSQIVAFHHGTHPPSSGQLQQLRKGSFLYSAYRNSAISIFFERWGVDLDFSIIPWSTSQINVKFQEMIPCRPWEVLFHHGSSSCQILPHNSVAVIVSRFTSLNLDFVLCCYRFSKILLLEVWLHLCVSCIEFQ